MRRAAPLLALLPLLLGGMALKQGLRPELLELIRGSRSSLLLQLPMLSDPQLKAALGEAAARGVKVRVLLSPLFRSNRLQAAAGLPGELRWDDANARYLVADLRRFALGSFNGVPDSLDSRVESALTGEDPAKAVELARLFEGRWKRAPRELPQGLKLRDEFDALPDPRSPEDLEPKLKTERRK